MQIKAIALDREFENNTNQTGWAITDGSAGLRGEIIKSDNLADIKLFAAAPDRNIAAKSLRSARLSDLMISPRRPALPSVMAQPVWLVLFSNSRSRAIALICISIPFCQINVQLLPLAMRSR